ncbi:hypothetical protein [Frigoribacterium sp. PvP032]|uniref:hypothetical protein n=1 Tax=Frigoribacterium sp. PvP032 TaxID=2806589 RepID=UPI001AE1621F|nr:hypothetical protein [Frigoribacterium sp. PvP032]MBP1190891.1 hypothetical protein [Frigoribacterium sp. PvP032]
MTTTPERPGQTHEPRTGPSRLVAASSFAVAAGIVALVALISYVILYATMWAPVVLWDNEGWLFLYPIFLAAWVPVGIMSATSLGLAIASCIRRETRRPLAVVSLGTAALLLTTSLPALRVGVGPL